MLAIESEMLSFPGIISPWAIIWAKRCGYRVRRLVPGAEVIDGSRVIICFVQWAGNDTRGFTLNE